ncbi:hypothetical protein HPB50_001450 [Hyalomma asiaticum]|uniref:Uncharacterized protein n=1 Tax=Hyalomma asiaticum TaxID=266040 RepID=A0ACB7SDW5_HYAAI|nr:hypothetical protein HPB50_001450 [Hyalomma asiaticum]
MSVQYCGVVGCPNGPGGKSARKTEREAGDDAWLAFHRVPSVEPRRSLWLTAVAFRKLEEKKLLVCSVHFRREDYTFDPVLCLSLGAYKRPFLNSDAVPSLLLGYDEQAPLQGEICGCQHLPCDKLMKPFAVATVSLEISLALQWKSLFAPQQLRVTSS